MENMYYKLESNVGTIADYPSGWAKELNIIAWNGGKAKYDIRDWDAEHTHMSRGCTLHEEEMRTLYELLKARFEKED